MNNLNFKVRSNSHPQGKSKVYFCAHTDDFEKYFDIISDEILARQNCAIWYPKDPNAMRDEEFLFELGQMQLFVIPVTRNFLCTENSALLIDFKFAIEHHIPVLPIMLESNLEALFNKKCGDIQFLDRNKIDETAIQYDKKLEIFLDSVLIGDDLADRIRDAFDGYIFLSYRKKDRKYALKLMKLIHQNELCRDLAIWYDEFLTPGEDFNDSIKGALIKSGLFALAITPNIVNEINYVMTVEYPMAADHQKVVFPAELIPTDREMLNSSYKDIPIPADANNQSEFSDALLSSVEKMPRQEHEQTPMHTFLIGLAYLSGIDVEVDYERAYSLILAAAEEGLIEAHEVLVSMFENGRGVKRDLVDAITWQKKLADLCLKHHKTTQSEDSMQKVCEVYLKLGDMLKCFADLTEAEESYNTALDVARLMENYNSTTAHKQIINALNRIALIKKEQGDYKKYNCLMREIVDYDNKTNDDDWLRAVRFSNLGLSYYFIQEYCQAEETYGKALEIINTCTVDSDDFLIVKSKIYNNIALLFAAMQNCDKAKAMYQNAIEIVEGVNARTDNAFVEEYCLYTTNLVSLLLKENDLDSAMKLSKKAIRIAAKKCCEIQTIGLLGGIATLENLIGRIYAEQKEIKRAEEHYKEALDWYLLWEDESEFIYRADIAVVRNNLAVLYISSGEYDLAEELLNLAYSTLCVLAENEKTHREMYALVGYNFGLTLCGKKMYKNAIKYFNESFDIYCILVKEGIVSPEMPKRVAAELINTYIKAGNPIKAMVFLFSFEKKLKKL